MSDFDKSIKLWEKYLEGNITLEELKEKCCELMSPQQALQFSMPKSPKPQCTLPGKE